MVWCFWPKEQSYPLIDECIYNTRTNHNHIYYSTRLYWKTNREWMMRCIRIRSDPYTQNTIFPKHHVGEDDDDDDDVVGYAALRVQHIIRNFISSRLWHLQHCLLIDLYSGVRMCITFCMWNDVHILSHTPNDPTHNCFNSMRSCSNTTRVYACETYDFPLPEPRAWNRLVRHCRRRRRRYNIWFDCFVH